jgi:hypothetical protein
MINNMHERAPARAPHQTERKENVFIDVRQPFRDSRMPFGKSPKEWLRPSRLDLGSPGSESGLKQIGDSRHAVLPIEPIIRDQ